MHLIFERGPDSAVAQATDPACFFFVVALFTVGSDEPELMGRHIRPAALASQSARISPSSCESHVAGCEVCSIVEYTPKPRQRERMDFRDRAN